MCDIEIGRRNNKPSVEFIELWLQFIYIIFILLVTCPLLLIIYITSANWIDYMIILNDIMPTQASMLLPCQPCINIDSLVFTDDENSKFSNIFNDKQNICTIRIVTNVYPLQWNKTVRAHGASTSNPIESIIYCQQSIDRCGFMNRLNSPFQFHHSFNSNDILKLKDLTANLLLIK